MTKAALRMCGVSSPSLVRLHTNKYASRLTETFLQREASNAVNAS